MKLLEIQGMGKDNGQTKIKGFTLVETLIAIAVLMIAVAGPLVIASKGLTAALYARDQMIASLLAQESMEKIKNIRDNNVSSAGFDAWLNGISGCEESLPCDATALEDGTAGVNTLCTVADGCGADVGGYPLYFVEGSGYRSDDDSGIPTQFRRYFYLHNTGGAVEDEENAANDMDTVTVVVTWTNGLITNEVRLLSELGQALR